LKKLLALIAFSILLLVPVGFQNSFAQEPLLIVETVSPDSELLQATNANLEDVIFDGGDLLSPASCQSVFFDARAEDFELAEAAFLRDVHLVGVEQEELPSTGLVYQIMEDNSGSPGNIIVTGTSVNFQKALISGGFFDYWFDLEDEVLLDGDTRYWISFKTPNDGSNLLLCQTDLVFGEVAYVFFEGASGWVESPHRFNFKLTGGQSNVPVGGEFIGIETVSVLAAGAQYTAAWMIPVLVSAIGIGIVIARKF